MFYSQWTTSTCKAALQGKAFPHLVLLHAWTAGTFSEVSSLAWMAKRQWNLLLFSTHTWSYSSSYLVFSGELWWELMAPFFPVPLHQIYLLHFSLDPSNNIQWLLPLPCYSNEFSHKTYNNKKWHGVFNCSPLLLTLLPASHLGLLSSCFV